MKFVFYKIKTSVIVTLVVLVSTLILSPQNAYTQRLSFRKYSVKEGLSQSQIFDIVQDGRGYLWFATAEGLTRFNGKQFVHYSKKEGLAGTFISKMYLDSQGNLWLGHRAMGISKYRPDRNTFEQIILPDGYQHANIRDIIEDEQGVIWFGTDGGGVFQYRGECFEQFGPREGLIDDAIWTILEDRKGGYWFGSERGLTYFPKGLKHRPRYYSSRDWQGEDMVMDIQEDSRGYLWICVHGSGPREFNPKSNTFRMIEGLDDKNIINVEEDKEGNLWFGSFSNGAFKLDPKTGAIQNFRKEDGLASNTIFKILKARNDHLWFATNRAGITRYDGEKFTNYGIKQGLSAISV